jgi:hypothetical protein
MSFGVAPVAVVLSIALAHFSALWLEDKNRFLNLILKIEVCVFDKIKWAVSHVGVFIKIRALLEKSGLVSNFGHRKKEEEKLQSTG